MLELLINIQEVDDKTALSIPRGLYITDETDKQMVVEAMDHSYVHAWRERMKWWERSVAIGAVLAGKELLSNLPFIKKGYANANRAYAQASGGHAGAQWHQALFGMVRDTVEETTGDPNNLVQISSHVQPVIQGIQAGLQIMRQEQVAKATKRKEPVPPPKYNFQMEEVGVIHYDYTRQRMTVVPLGALGLGPGNAIPERPTGSVGPYHEGMTKDGSPVLQWLNHYLFGGEKPSISPGPDAPGAHPPAPPPGMATGKDQQTAIDQTRTAVQDALKGADHGAPSPAELLRRARDQRRMKAVLDGTASHNTGTNYWLTYPERNNRQ